MRSSRFKNVLAVIIMGALAMGLTGCNFEVASGRNNPAGKTLSIQKGKQCTIQFRRDALGAARDLPVSPTTGSINGAEVSVSGKFVAMDQEWVVINQGSGREIWVPRNMVLAIMVF